ncbi:MAG: PIN/TRAM domain-containing protein [Planctomycetota bacterium]
MPLDTRTSQKTGAAPYYIIRAIFVLIFTYTSWKLGAAIEETGSGALAGIFIGIIGSMLLVAFEAYFSQHYLSLFYSVISGLLFGLLISVFFVQIIAYIPEEYIPKTPKGTEQKAIIGLLMTIFCCYLSVILVLRARNAYRLIIPFVELKQEGPQRKRILLDSSVIVDGRLADICDTLIIDQTMFLPDFVLANIHKIADHSDPIKRTRGRRGLDMLNKLRTNTRMQIDMIATQYPEEMIAESRLIELARESNARILTTDNALHKLAQLQGIEVINVHELETALRPVVLVGEELAIKIIRPGEEQDQGIGHLEDGTMVVVKNGRKYVGRELMVSVSSVLQRNTGRMIFAEFVEEMDSGSGANDSSDDRSDRGSHRDRDERRSGRKKKGG